MLARARHPVTYGGSWPSTRLTSSGWWAPARRIPAGPPSWKRASPTATGATHSHRRRYNHAGSTFNPPAAGATRRRMAQLFALARHLRALLSQSRALHAEDFLPAAGGKATAVFRWIRIIPKAMTPPNCAAACKAV